MTIRVKKAFLIAGILISVLSACLGLETKHSNHLGWALLFTGIIFSACGAITLGILFLREKSEGKKRDHSLWLPIFSVFALSLVTPLEYLYMTPILARNDYLQDIGLILFAGGLCFYLLMLSTPAPSDNSSPSVERLQTGAIHWFCHPGFACLILLALGLSIGYSSLIGLLIIFVFVLPGLIIWMRAEHQKLKDPISGKDHFA